MVQEVDNNGPNTRVLPKMTNYTKNFCTVYIIKYYSYNLILKLYLIIQ